MTMKVFLTKYRAQIRTRFNHDRVAWILANDDLYSLARRENITLW